MTAETNKVENICRTSQGSISGRDRINYSQWSREHHWWSA